MTFDNNIVNPSADEFVLVTNTSDRVAARKNKPSVIAGQALLLDVTARDATLKIDGCYLLYRRCEGLAMDSDGNAWCPRCLSRARVLRIMETVLPRWMAIPGLQECSRVSW